MHVNDDPRKMGQIIGRDRRDMKGMDRRAMVDRDRCAIIGRDRRVYDGGSLRLTTVPITAGRYTCS